MEKQKLYIPEETSNLNNNGFFIHRRKNLERQAREEQEQIDKKRIW